jgi:uncharacterized protein (TIGR03000 family)
MYSLVLMAAMSGSPELAGADQPAAVVVAPAADVVIGGCTGCTGCTGYVSSCYGCCGGRGGLFGLKHKGASCTGCCGGSIAYSSCHGCCGGGLFGHKHKAGYGCCGGFSAGYGCCGGTVWGGAWSTPAAPAYATPIAPAAPLVVPETTKPDTKKGASLKFNLPADATLYVDGNKTQGVGAERLYFTPPLEAGQKYFYDVKAEIVVDGKTVVEEKRVIVEAGADISESFPKVLAAATASGTKVAGK